MNSVAGGEVVSQRVFPQVFLNQNSTAPSPIEMIRLLLMAVEWVYLPMYFEKKGPEEEMLGGYPDLRIIIPNQNYCGSILWSEIEFF